MTSFDGGRRAPCAKLLAAARILGVPALVTEQYPKGLGHSAPELGLQDEPRDREDRLLGRARRRLRPRRARPGVVCGIEAHVCVSQTVHDLLERGVEVHVPADAVGSRHEIDYERGLERLERAGAVVGTVEAVAVRAARARRHAGVQGTSRS